MELHADIPQSWNRAYGGPGDDFYVLYALPGPDAAADRIVEQAAAGFDIVRILDQVTNTGTLPARGPFTAPPHVEVVEARLASGPLILTANAQGTILSGGSGPDTLVGGAGPDVFVAGVLVVDGGTAAGVDTVVGFDPAAGDRLAFPEGAVFTGPGLPTRDLAIGWMQQDGDTYVVMADSSRESNPTVRLIGLYEPTAGYFVDGATLLV